MEPCPPQRDTTEGASGLAFPEHQRSHCYQLFWARQETPDPSLEIYFHGRTEAVCPEAVCPTQGSPESTPCQSVLGTRLCESDTHRVTPAGWPPRVSSGVHCAVRNATAHFSLPLPHFIESLFQHGGPLTKTTGGQMPGRGCFALGSLEGGQLDRALRKGVGPWG